MMRRFIVMAITWLGFAKTKTGKQVDDYIYPWYYDQKD